MARPKNKKGQAGQQRNKQVAKTNAGRRPPVVSAKRGKREQDPVVRRLKQLDNHEKILDPQLVAWFKQLNDLFSRTATPTGMPLFEDNFPCPTTLVANYASKEFVGGANNYIHAWCFPNGIASTDGDDARTNVTVTVSGAVNVNLGGNLSGTNANAAFLTTQTNVEAMDSGPSAWVSTTACTYDNLINPFALEPQAAGGSGQFRCAAMGLRFTYTGRLKDTEGYVEIMQPYETPDVISVTNFRRDASHKKLYFSNKGSHEYYWQPTCDDVRFSDVNRAPAAGTTQPSRLFWRLGNLSTDDKVTVEVVSIFEYAGSPSISTQTPRLLTPDATHAVNALVTGHGIAAHPASAPTKLHTLAAAHKVSAHSIWRAVLDHGEDVIKDVTKAGVIVTKGAKLISSFL